uniref:Uncharacterized protein n=1 Tax=Arundo donax TaxID=35708 RepID=A0A0A9G1V8_ARUDO
MAAVGSGAAVACSRNCPKRSPRAALKLLLPFSGQAQRRRG